MARATDSRSSQEKEVDVKGGSGRDAVSRGSTIVSRADKGWRGFSPLE